MWYLKLILICVFACVLFQDFKSRLVYWFLYPIIGVLAFIIQLSTVPLIITLVNIGFNLLFVAVILGVSMIYLRGRSLNVGGAIGIGDVLFFIFICCTFSIVSFIVLFVFSLIFSLLLHLVFSNKKDMTTVPLAGYMSFFFAVVYLVSFCCNDTFLYAY